MSPGLWLTPQQYRPLVIPLLPTNPLRFSLPPYYSHATPTPRWLGCQELRCMGLCREPPPLLSSASENKMFCSLSPLLPLPPPHRSNASPSASQWSRSCQKLRPTATLRFALFFPPLLILTGIDFAQENSCRSSPATFQKVARVLCDGLLSTQE